MNRPGTAGKTKAIEAGKLYAIAYAAHYMAQDLRQAFALYRSLMATHAGTPEAGYSRAQILNIAQAVVPREQLFDAQVDLALACFGGGEPAPEARSRDAEDHQAR